MALRLLETIINEEHAPDPAKLAEMAEVWDARVSPLGDKTVLVRVLCEEDRVEGILHQLEESVPGTGEFRAMIMRVEATYPLPEPDEKEEQEEKAPTPDDSKEEEKKRRSRVASIELVQQMDDATEISQTFLLAVVLSTIVAALGLMQDSPAVVIGAMVIAPLLTPNMALALSATLALTKLARQAILINVIGLALSYAVAVVMGVMVSFDPEVTEIASRSSVTYGALVLALCAGSAGALSMTTGVSAQLVGVMVAVALLPPLAASGLLLASGDFAGAGGAMLLVIVNVIGVNLAAILTFLYQGIRPRDYWEKEKASNMVTKALVLWAVLLLVLLGLIHFTNP